MCIPLRTFCITSHCFIFVKNKPQSTLHGNPILSSNYLAQPFIERNLTSIEMANSWKDKCIRERVARDGQGTLHHDASSHPAAPERFLVSFLGAGLPTCFLPPSRPPSPSHNPPSLCPELRFILMGPRLSLWDLAVGFISGPTHLGNPPHATGWV